MNIITTKDDVRIFCKDRDPKPRSRLCSIRAGH